MDHPSFVRAGSGHNDQQLTQRCARCVNTVIAVLLSCICKAQLNWMNVDSLYQPLPASIHVYKTTDPLDGKPNVAFYVIADLKNKKLDFTVDTTYKRRLTPQQFYLKNEQPLVVVNTTFFSFTTNENLNVVIKDRKMVARNIHTIAGKAKDTLTYRHVFGSAIGIRRNRKADVAWILTGNSRNVWASQYPVPVIKDSVNSIYTPHPKRDILRRLWDRNSFPFTTWPWRMKTAVGGGPVLLQDGAIRITNKEELKFAGKAIDDKHPRTAMGYTTDGKLIILVVQGRTPGIAEGATLPQLAEIFKQLGCKEALNMDGGGSSCMLVNGKETIRVSDVTGQRPVPAVFIIKRK